MFNDDIKNGDRVYYFDGRYHTITMVRIVDIKKSQYMALVSDGEKKFYTATSYLYHDRKELIDAIQSTIQKLKNELIILGMGR